MRLLRKGPPTRGDWEARRRRAARKRAADAKPRYGEAPALRGRRFRRDQTPRHSRTGPGRQLRPSRDRTDHLRAAQVGLHAPRGHVPHPLPGLVRDHAAHNRADRKTRLPQVRLAARAHAAGNTPDQPEASLSARCLTVYCPGSSTRRHVPHPLVSKAGVDLAYPDDDHLVSADLRTGVGLRRGVRAVEEGLDVAELRQARPVAAGAWPIGPVGACLDLGPDEPRAVPEGRPGPRRRAQGRASRLERPPSCRLPPLRRPDRRARRPRRSWPVPGPARSGAARVRRLRGIPRSACCSLGCDEPLPSSSLLRISAAAVAP